MSNAKVNISIADKLRPLAEPARYKVAYGGRGGAKSRGFASALLIFALSGPERILCCREIQNSIKDSVKRLLDDEIKRNGWDGLFASTNAEIICKPTGATFIFAGLRGNINSIKSMEGITKCWCEEAHTISQHSLDVLIPTIRADDSEIWFSYNPEYSTDPVHKMFVVDEPPPDSVVIKINHDDNPWFPSVLKRKLEWDKQHDYDKYLHVWEGETVQFSEAQVMHGIWRTEDVPTPPPGTLFYHGLDFGFSNDPTALVRAWIDGRILYIDREAYGDAIEIDALPDFVDQIDTAGDWRIVADSSRPETISYLSRTHKVEGAHKGKGSIEDGISLVRSFDVVIDKSCKNIINEFTRYSYKKDPKTEEITPVIIDAYNHGIDALRYALEPLNSEPVFVKMPPVFAKPVSVPAWYSSIIGMHIGRAEVSVVLAWYNSDKDALYIRDEKILHKSGAVLMAAALKSWGNYPIVWTGDGNQSDLAEQYADAGLLMIEGSHKVDVTIAEMHDLIATERLMTQEGLHDLSGQLSDYSYRDGVSVGADGLIKATTAATLNSNYAGGGRQEVAPEPEMEPEF